MQWYILGAYMENNKAFGISTSNWFRIGAGGVELTTTAGGGTLTPLSVSNLTASGTVEAASYTLGGVAQQSVGTGDSVEFAGFESTASRNYLRNGAYLRFGGGTEIRGGGTASSNYYFRFGYGGGNDTEINLGGVNTANLTASGTVTAAGATFNGLVSQTGLGGSTYFGEGAGVVDDLSANNNVGVGFQALKSNITGSNNTASGYQSLCFNTTGSSNTASGYQSLRSNTTGSSNAASGHQSLRYNTTGPRNTASGYQSLYFNNTGINNTASGYQSLYFNTTGNSNTASGYLAGRYIADGTTANETSSTSIYLGAETKALANGDANEIVIGFDATGAGSNTATLGNASITKTVLRGDVETDGTVTAGAYNVATLPLTPSTGMRAYVTNSSVAASGNFGATVAAGGANIVPVFYDGTNWIIA
jgi:hypothetical protein